MDTPEDESSNGFLEHTLIESQQISYLETKELLGRPRKADSISKPKVKEGFSDTDKALNEVDLELPLYKKEDALAERVARTYPGKSLFKKSSSIDQLFVNPDKMDEIDFAKVLNIAAKPTVDITASKSSVKTYGRKKPSSFESFGLPDDPIVPNCAVPSAKNKLDTEICDLCEITIQMEFDMASFISDNFLFHSDDIRVKSDVDKIKKKVRNITKVSLEKDENHVAVTPSKPNRNIIHDNLNKLYTSTPNMCYSAPFENSLKKTEEKGIKIVNSERLRCEDNEKSVQIIDSSREENYNSSVFNNSSIIEIGSSLEDSSHASKSNGAIATVHSETETVKSTHSQEKLEIISNECILLENLSSNIIDKVSPSASCVQVNKLKKDIKKAFTLSKDTTVLPKRHLRSSIKLIEENSKDRDATKTFLHNNSIDASQIKESNAKIEKELQNSTQVCIQRKSESFKSVDNINVVRKADEKSVDFQNKIDTNTAIGLSENRISTKNAKSIEPASTDAEPKLRRTRSSKAHEENINTATNISNESFENDLLNSVNSKRSIKGTNKINRNLNKDIIVHSTLDSLESKLDDGKISHPNRFKPKLDEINKKLQPSTLKSNVDKDRKKSVPITLKPAVNEDNKKLLPNILNKVNSNKIDVISNDQSAFEVKSVPEPEKLQDFNDIEDLIPKYVLRSHYENKLEKNVASLKEQSASLKLSTNKKGKKTSGTVITVNIETGEEKPQKEVNLQSDLATKRILRSSQNNLLKSPEFGSPASQIVMETISPIIKLRTRKQVDPQPLQSGSNNIKKSSKKLSKTMEQEQSHYIEEIAQVLYDDSNILESSINKNEDIFTVEDEDVVFTISNSKKSSFLSKSQEYLQNSQKSIPEKVSQLSASISKQSSKMEQITSSPKKLRSRTLDKSQESARDQSVVEKEELQGSQFNTSTRRLRSSLQSNDLKLDNEALIKKKTVTSSVIRKTRSHSFSKSTDPLEDPVNIDNESNLREVRSRSFSKSHEEHIQLLETLKVTGESFFSQDRSSNSDIDEESKKVIHEMLLNDIKLIEPRRCLRSFHNPVENLEMSKVDSAKVEKQVDDLKKNDVKSIGEILNKNGIIAEIRIMLKQLPEENTNYKKLMEEPNSEVLNADVDKLIYQNKKTYPLSTTKDESNKEYKTLRKSARLSNVENDVKELENNKSKTTIMLQDDCIADSMTNSDKHLNTIKQSKLGNKKRFLDKMDTEYVPIIQPNKSITNEIANCKQSESNNLLENTTLKDKCSTDSVDNEFGTQKDKTRKLQEDSISTDSIPNKIEEINTSKRGRSRRKKMSANTGTENVSRELLNKITEPNRLKTNNKCLTPIDIFQASKQFKCFDNELTLDKFKSKKDFIANENIDNCQEAIKKGNKNTSTLYSIADSITNPIEISNKDLNTLKQGRPRKKKILVQSEVATENDSKELLHKIDLISEPNKIKTNGATNCEQSEFNILEKLPSTDKFSTSSTDIFQTSKNFESLDDELKSDKVKNREDTIANENIEISSEAIKNDTITTNVKMPSILDNEKKNNTPLDIIIPFDNISKALLVNLENSNYVPKISVPTGEISSDTQNDSKFKEIKSQEDSISSVTFNKHLLTVNKDNSFGTNLDNSPVILEEPNNENKILFDNAVDFQSVPELSIDDKLNTINEEHSKEKKKENYSEKSTTILNQFVVNDIGCNEILNQKSKNSVMSTDNILEEIDIFVQNETVDTQPIINNKEFEDARNSSDQNKEIELKNIRRSSRLSKTIETESVEIDKTIISDNIVVTNQICMEEDQSYQTVKSGIEEETEVSELAKTIQDKCRTTNNETKKEKTPIHNIRKSSRLSKDSTDLSFHFNKVFTEEITMQIEEEMESAKVNRRKSPQFSKSEPELIDDNLEENLTEGLSTFSESKADERLTIPDKIIVEENLAILVSNEENTADTDSSSKSINKISPDLYQEKTALTLQVLTHSKENEIVEHATRTVSTKSKSIEFEAVESIENNFISITSKKLTSTSETGNLPISIQENKTLDVGEISQLESLKAEEKKGEGTNVFESNSKLRVFDDVSIKENTVKLPAVRQTDSPPGADELEMDEEDRPLNERLKQLNGPKTQINKILRLSLSKEYEVAKSGPDVTKDTQFIISSNLNQKQVDSERSLRVLQPLELLKRKDENVELDNTPLSQRIIDSHQLNMNINSRKSARLSRNADRKEASEIKYNKTATSTVKERSFGDSAKFLRKSSHSLKINYAEFSSSDDILTDEDIKTEELSEDEADCIAKKALDKAEDDCEDDKNKLKIDHNINELVNDFAEDNKDLKVDKSESSCFCIGDIVWAKIGSCPYWPSLVTSEPESDEFHRTTATSRFELYHVRFFGDQGRRAWIRHINLFHYNGKNDLELRANKLKANRKFNIINEAYTVKQCWKEKWLLAVKEVESLKNKSLEEKLNFFKEIVHRKKENKHKLDKDDTSSLNSESLESVSSKRKYDRLKRNSSATRGRPSLSPPRKRLREDRTEEEDVFLPRLRRRRKASEDETSEDLESKLSENSVNTSALAIQSTLFNRNKLFRGVSKEKVCQQCFKPDDVYRCKGKCYGSYHYKCAMNMVDVKEETDQKSVKCRRSNDESIINSDDSINNDIETKHVIVHPEKCSKEIPKECEQGNLSISEDLLQTSLSKVKSVIKEDEDEPNIDSQKRISTLPVLKSEAENNDNIVKAATSPIQNDYSLIDKTIDEVIKVSVELSSPKDKPISPIGNVQIITVHSTINNTPPRKTFPANFRNMSLAEQIDYKMKEIMRKFETRTMYGDSTSDSSCEESAKKKMVNNAVVQTLFRKPLPSLSSSSQQKDDKYLQIQANVNGIANINRTDDKDDKQSTDSRTKDDVEKTVTETENVDLENKENKGTEKFIEDIQDQKIEQENETLNAIIDDSNKEQEQTLEPNSSKAAIELKETSTVEKSSLITSALKKRDRIRRAQLKKKKRKRKTKRQAPNELDVGIKHVTADADITPEEAESIDIKNFKCGFCATNADPFCGVCMKFVSPSGSNVRQKCSLGYCGKYYHQECLKPWPQTQWMLTQTILKNSVVDTFVCPIHACHTCVSDDPRMAHMYRCYSDKLVRCLCCPAAYHLSSLCLPAGSEIVTSSQIICPRHSKYSKQQPVMNTNWCFLCSRGGDLICCETCPMSAHPDCLPKEIQPDEIFICEDCESGRYPLYDEIVWCKLGIYRWWPGVVLFPNEIPDNILKIPHDRGEFVVKFYGTYDHHWFSKGRTFLFHEGDKGQTSANKQGIDMKFLTAVDEATIAHRIKREFKHSKELERQKDSKPPPYIKIKVNKPVGNVRQFDPNLSNTTACECDSKAPHPCGPDSDCLNRLLLTECNPDVCPAGKRCNNQCFEKKEYPPLVPHKTSERGWGLKTLAPIKKGQFVIEYVGEMIDETEYQRRIAKMHECMEENYYFLTIDKDRMLDAGPKGNVARFMNHSCQPNCETQKWTVNGDTRVGLFATEDIPADSELTFNYNLECVGKEKKVCMCGAPNCNGFIGVKAKQSESQKRTKKNKMKKPLKPPNEVNKNPCFICRRKGQVTGCNNKICNKSYHLRCLKMDAWPEGNKFICPWHNCNVCSKRTIRCCVRCINSYCPQHSEGNIRHDNLLGFICSDHDPTKETQLIEIPTKLVNPKIAVLTDESTVTSTTSEDEWQPYQRKKLRLKKLKKKRRSEDVEVVVPLNESQEVEDDEDSIVSSASLPDLLISSKRSRNRRSSGEMGRLRKRQKRHDIKNDSDSLHDNVKCGDSSTLKTRASNLSSSVLHSCNTSSKELSRSKRARHRCETTL